MLSLKKYNLIFLFILFCAASVAQEGTRTNTNTSTEATNGKIMIVPFEPKLYMSDIDQKINQQTKWGFETIRENFRHQLDAQLKLKFQSISPVVSFYSDSAKMSKDLEYVYKSTNISYDLVSKPTEATKVNKQQSGIKNGQVAVEMNNDLKFMNTKITNNELLSYLNKKYSVDYFIFINELDIKNDMNSYDITQDVYQREITVHYSILDKTGKTITAGIATSKFSSKENLPKKIVAQNFSPIATFISAKFSSLVKPKAAPQKN
ncbi:MAG: hypothetical protein ACXVPU_00065 [Bacteroidia bacterium]